MCEQVMVSIMQKQYYTPGGVYHACMPWCYWPSVGKIVKVIHSWVICLCRHCVGPRWAMIYIYPCGEVYALLGNILAVGGDSNNITVG